MTVPIYDTWCAWDTESTGTRFHRGHRVFAVSACDYEEKTYWWEWFVNPKTRLPEIPEADVEEINELADQYELHVFHNAPFDETGFDYLGVDFSQRKVWDTASTSHVISSGSSHKLKDLALLHFDILDDDQKELQKAVIKAGYYGRKQGWNLGDNTHWNYWLPRAVARHAKYPLKFLKNGKIDEANTHPFWLVVKRYGTRDAERTAYLYLSQIEHPVVEKCFHVGFHNVVKREHDLIPVIRNLQSHGVTLHKSQAKKAIKRHSKARDKQFETCKKIVKLPELNLNSPKQLIPVLYDQLDLTPTRWTKTGPSTDAKCLAKMRTEVETSLLRRKTKQNQNQFDFLTALLTGRKAGSASNAYNRYSRSLEDIPGCDDYGVLYSSYNQIGAKRTTRFSCSDENVMNVGKGKRTEDDELEYVVRDAFGPRPGRIWYDYDYDQLQVRIFAYAAHEQSIIDAFDAGIDFHDFVASRLFKTDTPDKLQRRIAKNVNFALIFGGGKGKVDDTAGEAGTYDRYRKLFPGIDRFMDSVISFVRKYGYVNTLGGYRLDVPRNKPYVGANYIIQGTEGDIAKAALIDVHNYLEDYETIRKYLINYITMFVHDEIVVDGKKHKDLPMPLLKGIQTRMEKCGKRLGVKTPVGCSIVTKSWDDPTEIAL